MKKFSEWVMALLFSGTLLVLMAATILLPKERYSYYENRNLSAFPEISVESIANGKVFGELETMFCDYAAWRTAALRAVTWCDLNLFHRPVVNEVVVTPDALLEELYTMPDTAEDIVREADTVAADNAALRDQIEAYGGYYCYLAVPCQYAYYEDAYPAYLENRAAYTAAERAALREAMEARCPIPTWARARASCSACAATMKSSSRPRSPRTSPSPASITARRRRPRSTRFRAATPSR